MTVNFLIVWEQDFYVGCGGGFQDSVFYGRAKDIELALRFRW